MSDWYDDDSLWSALEPFLFTDEHCGDGARHEVDLTMALLKVEPGAAILDLCCGPGRHALELARRAQAAHCGAPHARIPAR